ncbi:hypothetical protein SAMN05192541_1692 [Bradyrhizobium arachidis]|nr:hypothetical protein SAMN05192541_1692 [Bradyrhizobium arachidis]
MKCLGCDTHQTVALDIVRRSKTIPVHELERYTRCRHCSERQDTLKASGPEFDAGIKYAIEQGWLEPHESGTYIRLLTQAKDLLTS